MCCAAFACSGKINVEFLGSTSDDYVFGNRIVDTVKPQSGGLAVTAQQAYGLRWYRCYPST